MVTLLAKWVLVQCNGDFLKAENLVQYLYWQLTYPVPCAQ